MPGCAPEPGREGCRGAGDQGDGSGGGSSEGGNHRQLDNYLKVNFGNVTLKSYPSVIFYFSRFLETSVSWDKHVPGNTVSFLFSVSDQETVVKIGELLRTKLVSEGFVSDRVYAAGLLAKLVAHPQVINNIDWRVSILSTLLELTVITVPASKVPALSKEAKLQLKDVFYRGLDSNCKTLMDTVNLVSRLMKHAQSLLEKQAGAALVLFIA